MMSGTLGDNVLSHMIGDTKCMNYDERDSFGCPANSADLCLAYNHSDPIFTETVLTEFNIFCDRANLVRYVLLSSKVSIKTLQSYAKHSTGWPSR